MCITQRQREGEHFAASSPLKLECAHSFNHCCVGEVSGQPHTHTHTHLQEIILDVAIEGAAEADRVVLPALVGLKVEAKLGPAVLQTQAQGRLHLQEHGGQLLDVDQVCGSGGRTRFSSPGTLDSYSVIDSQSESS